MACDGPDFKVLVPYEKNIYGRVRCKTEGKWFALSKADQWQETGMYVKHYKEPLPFIEYVIYA